MNNKPNNQITGVNPKAKDLVGLLVRHYAIARLTARPRVKTTLQCLPHIGVLQMYGTECVVIKAGSIK